MPSTSLAASDGDRASQNFWNAASAGDGDSARTAIAITTSASDVRRVNFIARYSTVVTKDTSRYGSARVDNESRRVDNESRRVNTGQRRVEEEMSSTTAVSTPAITRVPLWINGQAARSTSERSGDVTNPATGEVIR